MLCPAPDSSRRVAAGEQLHECLHSVLRIAGRGQRDGLEGLVIAIPASQFVISLSEVTGESSSSFMSRCWGSVAVRAISA